MTVALQTHWPPPIENRTLPVFFTTSPPPDHEAPVTVPPPPGGWGLALIWIWPLAWRSRSRGLALAIRSAVQYLTIRSCSALAFASAVGLAAAVGATATATSASEANPRVIEASGPASRGSTHWTWFLPMDRGMAVAAAVVVARSLLGRGRHAVSADGPVVRRVT